MAELISFSEDECGSGSGDSDSGVAESYIAKCRDLSFDLATFDVDGNLTDIPWATVSSPYVHIVPTNDDSAYYNQKYDDVNDLVVQEGYFRISGINATNVAAADLYKDGCCFVAIHVLQNGKAIIQGVEKVFYEGEFHLVPSGGKTTAKSVNVNTNSGPLPARLDFVLSSYSEHFSLFIEDINPFLDIEPPDVPVGTPTISNNITGAVIAAPTVSTADCGHGTVKTAVYLNNDPAGHISLGSYPFDAAAHFCRQDANGATSIKVSSTVTTICGTVADVDTIPITVTGGIISHVNGVLCSGLLPSVVLSRSANSLSATYNSKGFAITLKNLVFNLSSGEILVDLDADPFPVNLNTYVCGLVNSSDSFNATARVDTVIGSTTHTLNIPVTRDVYNRIISVGGVACPAPTITAPSVSATLDGATLEITWDDGGDLGAVRTLTLDNGSNSISLDTEVGSIDLGAVLYGEESAGATNQNYILYATITNSVDSDEDTSVIVPVITRDWSAGRFIHTVNGVMMPLPIASGATLSGNLITDVTVDMLLWKSVLIRIEMHRNPAFWDPGVYASSSSYNYDSVTGISSGSINFSLTYCGGDHVTGDDVYLLIKSHSGGTYGAEAIVPIPTVVNGSNIITSVNGVAC